MPRCRRGTKQRKFKGKNFVIPANEELVLAREVFRKLSHTKN
jgi:hypothetical protein